MLSHSRNAQGTFVEKPVFKIKNIDIYLPSFHGGSLKITLTVPLRKR